MCVLMIVGEEEIHIKPLYSILMKNNLGNIKECKTLIKHHHVTVNGRIIDNSNYIVNESDEIKVLGKLINSQPFVYYMMNKPEGYVCANKDQSYPCVTDLIERDDCICVGRLDKDTTGFLLLTNDKSLVKILLLPQNHRPKTYLVTTRYPIDESYRLRFQKGIIIDKNICCLPAQLEIIDSYHCYVTLNEGKYHQIKKMFLSCQNEVVMLKRIAFAGVILDETLDAGEYRQLSQEEFQKMKEFIS